MRRTGLMSLAAGLAITSSALAAEPPIPTKYVSGDTAIVARVTLADITAQKIQDTVTALVDRAALEKAGFEGDPMEPLQAIMGQMMMAQGFMGGMIQMGATSLNMTMVPPEEEGDQPSMRLFMPVSSQDSGNQLAQMFQSFGMGGNVENLNGQNWISISGPGMPPPPSGGGSGETTGHFNAGLESMGSATISLVVIPVEKIREQIIENLEDENDQAREVGTAISNAKWVGLNVSLGSKPTIVLTADLPDEKSAKTLDGAWDKFLGEFVAKAKEAEADEDMGEWPDSMPKPTEMAKTLSKYMDMEISGTRLTMTLDTAELRQMTTWGILASDSFGFNPMDFMGGM